MINVDNNMAKKLNANSRRLAKGITSFPFEAPQFYRDGGEVDLFKQNTYPQQQNLAQRLPTAGSNAATQSQDLRFNMDKQGKSYMPKPDPYRVNLGANPGVSIPPAIKPLGPTLVDSNMVANVAANAANQYRGPYQDKVKEMFPVPRYKDGGMVDPERSKNDAKRVDPTKPEGYGLIEGPGTGKSDDIDATLNQQDYILPVETVEMIGRPVLDSLVARIMGDEQMEGEGQPEVEAKVSNQEYRVPYPVVEELGVEFFDRLKQMSGVPDLSKRVDGKPAYEAKGLVEDEEKKNQQSLQSLPKPVSNIVNTLAVPKFLSEETAKYNSLRDRGYGVIPANIIQAQRQVINPALNASKSVGNAVGQGYDELFKTPQSNIKQDLSKTTQPPVKDDKPKTDLSKSGIDNGQQQTQSPVNIDPISGLTNDSRPQVLYWGEQRFNNSGDLAQDQAIEDRQRRIRDYNDQREASIPSYSEEFTQGKYGVSNSSSRGGFSPNAVNLGQRLQDNPQQESNKYAYETGNGLYPTQGPAADSAYQQQQQFKSDYNAALKAINDLQADEKTKKYAQYIIDRYNNLFELN